MAISERPTGRSPALEGRVPRPDKQPANALAGAYGHPIHPILVTIPIGAWIASLVFDIASRSADDAETFSTGADWLVAIGAIGAVLAALWGFMDYLRIPRRTRAFRIGTMHLLINDVVLIAFVVSWAIRLADDGDETSLGLIALSVVALLLLSVSGWLGGMLAYRLGVRVADEATQNEGFTARDGSSGRDRLEPQSARPREMP